MLLDELLHKDAEVHGLLDAPAGESQRIITLRIPKSLHARLRDVAYEKHTSMNRLCRAVLASIEPATATHPGPSYPPVEPPIT